MIVVWVTLALAVGFAAGWVTGVRRPRPSSSPSAEPVGRHGTAAVTEPLLDTLRRACDELAVSLVIGDSDGRVIYRNRPAMALGGTHVGVIVDGHIEHALEHAMRDGRLERRIDLHGPPRVTLELRAERLENGVVVAMVDDVSERMRIDAMRTDFVANISHELKTPVGALAVLAESLEGEDDLAVVERMTARIVAESHRAVTTIDDLLELSRIESSTRNDEAVDLADVADQAVARGRGVDPSVQISAIRPGEKIEVRGDRRQLTSAIGNLVENAVKYSDPGGTVEISARVGERHVEVTVSDQGHGIPARDLGRIFERFYRVDRARSRDTGGTGLGLSIVRHVAHNHGGEINVSSVEGEGSTFELRLPIALLIAQRPSSTKTFEHHERVAGHRADDALEEQ